MRPLKEWTNGTPENNYQDGTQLDAADFESWSKELMAVLTGAGIVPDPAKYDQLLTAIRGLTVPLVSKALGSPAELDNLRTNGFYIVFGVNGDGQVLHIQHPNSTTYAVQLMFGQWGQATPSAGAGFSYRALVSGTWTGWQKIWHAANFDPQTQSATAFTTSGAAPAFALTPSPAITAYAANQRFRVKFHAAGAGADTLNVSGKGAKSIKQYDATGAKVAAVIAANQLADVEYDGADFVILSPLPAALSLGYGQTWQNVSGSRAAGTTYYNTTGKPIVVNVKTAQGSNATVLLTATVNGVSFVLGADNSAQYPMTAGHFIVPPGCSYSFTITSATLSEVHELR